ncbi:AAA family ATPase [Jatrophihabitans fulvus]
MTPCTSCGTENPATAKFCGECGTPLARTCPACGAAVGTAKFCGECGTPQQASVVVAPPLVAQPQTERRVCSVLFVDLVGFTPFTAARDAEDVRELLSHYFERARTIVERHGGVIEKFIGDAVMAIWGTPIALEGDAERAVRAALELVAAVAELGTDEGATGLSARAGVVTGDVAVTVGLVGEGVAGDTVNTAARVQSVADPGSVWVDDVTERLTHAVIGYRDAGEHTLKGKAEPMHLWAATRVLSTVGGVQRVDGLEAPLVGRDVEWRTLKDLFHVSAERATPRLVVLSGPAGVGKSRLGWQFRTYVDGLASEVYWHRGRCLTYGEGVAFWALAEIVRQRFDIADEDTSATAAAKLADRLPGFVADAAECDYVGVRLGRLLGVRYGQDDGAPLPREELFAGWRLFFERLSADSPVVLLVEDAHHADPGLLEFLDHLVDWSRGAPLFVLVLARPDLADRAPGWGVGRNRATLALDPLDDGVMHTIVDALVPGMPDAVRAGIVDQAEGLPLYAVETIRSLIDRDVVVPRDGVYRLVGEVTDVTELAVPDTLRGLLAARYDALPGLLRSLLADAAVLGGTFPPEALVAVSGRDEHEVRRALDDLVRREIVDVTSDPLSPQRGTFGFSQNLLRQVVYETLSRRDRKARHLAVAAHLRSTFAGDGDEIVDVVAQHYVDALHAVPQDDDADALRALAVEALERAAARSLRSGAPQRAAEHLVAVADLIEPVDPAGAGVRLERAAETLIDIGSWPAALDHARRAEVLFVDAGLPRAAARARTRVAEALNRSGEIETAARLLREALNVLSAEPDGDTVLALCVAANNDAFAGDGEVAAARSEDAVRLAQALGVDRDLMARAFTVRGLAHAFLNHVEDACAALAHAVRLSERDLGSRWLAALNNLADQYLTNDPAAAFEAAVRTAENAQRRGDTYGYDLGTCNAAGAALWLGRWDDAAQRLDLAIADVPDGLSVLQTRLFLSALRGEVPLVRTALLARVATDDVQEVAYTATVDVARALVDDPRLALDRALVALERTPSLGLRHEARVWVWTLGVRAAREVGDRATQERLLDVLDGVPVGHLAPLLRAERALGRALLDRSETAAAEAVARLREVGSPFHLAHGLLDLADLRRDDGDDDGAATAVDEAAAVAAPLRAATLTRRLAALDRIEAVL